MTAGRRRPRPTIGLFGYGARYRLYQAADGWIYLAAPAEREWEALASAIAGDADLDGDARFADEASRRAHDSDLAQVLAAVFAARPAQYWEDHLLSRDVGCVVAHAEPPEAVLQSKEFAGAADLLVQVEHPSFGEHVRLKPYIELSRSETLAEPGVLAGQHTNDILAELGYDAPGDRQPEGTRHRGMTAPQQQTASRRQSPCWSASSTARCACCG